MITKRFVLLNLYFSEMFFARCGVTARCFDEAALPTNHQPCPDEVHPNRLTNQECLYRHACRGLFKGCRIATELPTYCCRPNGKDVEGSSPYFRAGETQQGDTELVAQTQKTLTFRAFGRRFYPKRLTKSTCVACT